MKKKIYGLKFLEKQNVEPVGGCPRYKTFYETSGTDPWTGTPIHDTGVDYHDPGMEDDDCPRIF